MTFKSAVKEMEESIAYCGLVCSFCSESKCGVCTGCRTKNEGCDTKDCCKSRNIVGCWECASFPCGGDMQKSHRVRAFVRCAKEDGIGELAAYLLKNAENGVCYHKADGTCGDYDVLENEEQVLRFLRTGKV
jgi:hypothetical protein